MTKRDKINEQIDVETMVMVVSALDMPPSAQQALAMYLYYKHPWPAIAERTGVDKQGLHYWLNKIVDGWVREYY